MVGCSIRCFLSTAYEWAKEELDDIVKSGVWPVQVVDRAMQWSPYTYDAKVVQRSDPNKKRRWLIPLVLAAQIAFKVAPRSSP